MAAMLGTSRCVTRNLGRVTSQRIKVQVSSRGKQTTPGTVAAVNIFRAPSACQSKWASHQTIQTCTRKGWSARGIWTTVTAFDDFKIVKTPPFAESVTEGDVRWEKAVGDYVNEDEVVGEIETDKTSIPVPSPVSGVIEEFLAADGDTVTAGQELFKVKVTAGGAPAEKPAPAAEKPAPAAAPAPAPPQPAAPAPAAPAAGPIPTTPPPLPPLPQQPITAKPVADMKPVAAAAPAMGVTAGARTENRKRGCERSADQLVLLPDPVDQPTDPVVSSHVPAHTPGPGNNPLVKETDVWGSTAHGRHLGLKDQQRGQVKMNRMRQRIAQRLKDAQNECAMLTTFQECDMRWASPHRSPSDNRSLQTVIPAEVELTGSNVIEMRSKHKDGFLKKHGVKLGFMSPFVKAAAFALQDQPVVNAVIEDKEIVYRDYIDISVAVATPRFQSRAHSQITHSVKNPQILSCHSSTLNCKFGQDSVLKGSLVPHPSVSLGVEIDAAYPWYCVLEFESLLIRGLVVPVIRDVGNMNYADIEKTIQELGEKLTLLQLGSKSPARKGELAIEDMDGGTFTISNGGVFGSMFGTPIINQPQSAILGMHAILDRPMAINGKNPMAIPMDTVSGRPDREICSQDLMCRDIDLVHSYQVERFWCCGTPDRNI
ncbi:hypothetical protein Bbelb_414420 [Branchiostoma belcheri]|nr:hypothetical protein Bbelb_414420 [Branchiostoma belcheri]